MCNKSIVVIAVVDRWREHSGFLSPLLEIITSDLSVNPVMDVNTFQGKVSAKEEDILGKDSLKHKNNNEYKSDRYKKS